MGEFVEDCVDRSSVSCTVFQPHPEPVQVLVTWCRPQPLNESEPRGSEVVSLAGQLEQLAGGVSDVLMRLLVALIRFGPFVAAVIEWFTVDQLECVSEQPDGLVRCRCPWVSGRSGALVGRALER